MDLAALNILLVQSMVKGDGLVEVVYQLIGFLLKSAGPKFHK
jgi:hypothetical protein